LERDKDYFVKKLLTLLSILGAVSAYLVFMPNPIEPKAWDAPENAGFTGVFESNNRLSSLQLISLNGEEGPEDVAVDLQGNAYFSVLSGKILKLDTNDVITEFASTGGRPLGLEFSATGELIVADAYKGLLSVSKSGEVTVLTDQVKGSRILYADDLDISATGEIYFTDASTKFSAKEYGTYEASLLDIMEHGGNGRVLKYSPYTKETKVLLAGLDFPNGIAVTHEQDALLVNETGTYSVLKLWIKGEKEGAVERVVENLPGFPDNLNKGIGEYYWLGLVSPRNQLLDAMSGQPRLRKAIQNLPPQVRPKAESYGHIVKIDSSGRILESFQDPESTYGFTTGAIENGDWLYLSSLHEKKLARLKNP
jgi:sugar lactone lactonase YvrE